MRAPPKKGTKVYIKYKKFKNPKPKTNLQQK